MARGKLNPKVRDPGLSSPGLASGSSLDSNRTSTLGSRLAWNPPRVLAWAISIVTIVVCGGLLATLLLDLDRNTDQRERRAERYGLPAQDQETSALQGERAGSTHPGERTDVTSGASGTDSKRDGRSGDDRRATSSSGRNGSSASRTGAGRFQSDHEVGKEWHPWPLREEEIGAPVGAAITRKKEETKTSPKAAPKTADGEEDLPEPQAPSAERIREVSALKESETETMEKLAAILRDARESSTIKLIAIQKLSACPPESAVPLLVEFLKGRTSAGGAYTKPTAVKVLVDMESPLADKAVEELATHAVDPRVRLAIASLAKK